ncbi:FAD-dependent oxidoreductase [Lentzea flaviverrucosa]|uniref:2-polyprenyl-6-methoxyphenol hydroxylase n=1 Tax=Lentzea flaviverrucosa TaxID=200379 RepID=A0A1H9V3F5_9PSEU|nr:NAD(P)/FAD-dependent oxidoreductase [Lentzea flaviverrucosa]RDI27560.1 2-polyprenyl-6-methoxyphenol hydroxylase-like FAD-dependent oxidoreductase [Lentzea flaviverrucosa]SES16245.1 2-polyprenyl-6-methoxyphenol hydroxylase [Lentzea flaviverrucosa]
MRIAVVGGGIGGLCLAHGLRRAGVDVAVYERDLSRTDRLQGYRVHINPHGAAALRECLPAASWERFERSAGTDGNGFGFLTEQLQPLLVLDPDEERHYSASRITLRQVLLDGLDVRFGKRFERYEQGDDIKLHFEDGTAESCDVLVGADGIRSRVRAQYLPHAGTEKIGVTAIAGKLFLDDNDWVPRELVDRANTVVPTSRAGMFLAAHDGLGVTDDDDLLFDNVRPYLMWAYAAADLTVHDGQDLQREVLARIAGWSPELTRIVATSPAETISEWRIRSSRPVERWQPTNVTLLGDAVHAMTPMRGIGANIALRDAQLLTRCIAEGGDAIARYEEEMYDYGFAAVRDSLKAARRFADGGPVARTIFRTVLRTASAVPVLKRAMF